MTDYIKRVVELADGFDIHYARVLRVLTNHGTFYVDYDEQFFLDALAAQLVRQVDAIENFELLIRRDVTQLINVYSEAFEMDEMIEYSGGHGRTMNTIRAIVDSGVLE